MIFRRKDYVKRAPSRDASKIYIICEGRGTEPSYYSFFEGLSSNLKLIIIPPEAGTDPIKLMQLAKDRLLSANKKFNLDYTQNDKVWFIIDTDSWDKEGKIAPLREFCDSLNKEILGNDSLIPYQAWHVSQSNPSFEVWLYFHHYNFIPSKEEVDESKSFKEFLNKKITGGFDFERDQVLLEPAIRNSKYNFKKDFDCKPVWFSTECFTLGDELLRFVKSELAKLRSKM